MRRLILCFAIIPGGARRAWLGRQGWVARGEHLHHWLVRQANPLARRFPGFFNQTWNLVHIDAKTHSALHSGRLLFSEVVRYGVPKWAKREALTVAAQPIRYTIRYLRALIGGKQCP